jgi:hypothetical protein
MGAISRLRWILLIFSKDCMRRRATEIRRNMNVRLRILPLCVRLLPEGVHFDEGAPL